MVTSQEANSSFPPTVSTTQTPVVHTSMILVFLGLSVLELGPMYATARRQT